MFDRPINSALPRQQVSWKIKFEVDKDKNNVTKWQKDSVDALEGIGRYVFYNNVELRKNYEIMEGRFNIQDYTDVFDTYDLSSAVYEQMKLPSYLKHYDKTTKIVKLLLGEFIKRPDIIKVLAKDLDSTNEKLRVKTDLLHMFIQQEITNEIGKKLKSQGIDPDKHDFKSQEEADQYKQEIQQKYQEMTPESIEKYMRYDYRTMGEEWGQAVLSNDLRRFRINEQDQIEFRDMLIVDRCFSHFFLTNSGYNVETWNPLNTYYQYSPDLRYIEDGNYVGRIMYLSKPQVIDLFGYRMTLDQIEGLYPEYQKNAQGGDVYSEFFNATLYPFADYREYDNLTVAVGQALGTNPMEGSPYGFPVFGFYPGVDGSNYLFTQADLVQVSQVYWKSQRKIGKLNIINPETGQSEVHIVDENFDPKLFGVEEVKEIYRDANEPNTICWTWGTQIWQGVKVNVNYQKDQEEADSRSSIYIDVRPVPFQFRGDDPKLIFSSKLPVCGEIFNNRNGRSQSVVDLFKPYQILCNAILNNAYHVLQKNNGKFFLIGASLLQSAKDLGGEESLEKFMTTATNMGLAVIDDSLNNTQGQMSMQYGLKVMDMDESERVTRLINLAMLVEQQGYLQLGITPQREGSIAATQTATGSTQAINNSYAVTEIYFEQYNNYRRRKLQMLIEIAQFVASREEDITLPYITSDGGQAFIQATGTDLLLKDLGIYTSNSAEDQRKKELAEQLILKNNQNLLPMSKLLEIIDFDSMADIRKSIEMAEAAQAKNAQAQQQAEQQAEQDKMKASAQEADKEREWKSQEAQLDRQNKIQLAEMKAIGDEGSYSQTENLVPNVIEQAKIDLQQSQHAFDRTIKQQELSLKHQDSQRKHTIETKKLDLQSKDQAIKKQELESKKALETKKLGTEDRKMKNDLTIAKLKTKIKPKVK